jgi:hypothetical protein
VLPLAVMIRSIKEGAFARGCKDAGTALLVIVLAVGLCVATALALGFEFTVGLPLGRAHDPLLMPLFADSPTTGMRLGSYDRLVQSGNIMLASTPLTLLAPWLLLAMWNTHDTQAVPRSTLSLPALGYIGFVLLWEFDLGVPGDYELMTSMGFVIALAVLGPFLRIAETSSIARGASTAGLLAAASFSFAVMSPFLTSALAGPVLVDQGAGTLRVNGKLVAGLDPVVVAVRGPDGTVEFQVDGPPGINIQFVAGPRSPNKVSTSWKHIGTPQVGTPPAFLDTRFMFRGRLDDTGRFVRRFPFRDAAPGPFLNVQMSFEHPPGTPAPFVLTPAAYIVIREPK